MNKTHLKFLNKEFNREYAEVKDGVATNVITGETIDKSLMLYHEIPADGLHELHPRTCGGGELSIPRGMEPTKENIEKYECRIGRRAPLCRNYAPGNCAVWGPEGVDESKIHIKPSELITLMKL